MDTNTTLFENDAAIDNNATPEQKTSDELKEVIGDTLKKVRTQSMLLGAQAICQTILNKVYAFESSHGKKTTNDYKRCLKDIKNFCEVGLSRKVNTDGTTEQIESETVQN